MTLEPQLVLYLEFEKIIPKPAVDFMSSLAHPEKHHTQAMFQVKGERDKQNKRENTFDDTRILTKYIV